MASHDGFAGSASARSDEGGYLSSVRQEMPGPPSIISSRMTDIASDDEHERNAPNSTSSQRQSVPASDAVSRPGTARTGMSSRGGWSHSQPLRPALSGNRGSTALSTTGSAGGRSQSSTSKSHVPSLTSHAFFRPMSSQKLQAQRGLSRPLTIGPSKMISEESAAELGGDRARHSFISNPVTALGLQLSGERELPPPSRGTQMTDQGTIDRHTATASPSHGHYASDSVSDSVRPLQKQTTQPSEPNVRIEKSNKPKRTSPTSIRSPRSFRNSFRLPSRNGSAQNNANRNHQTREKLDSSASSPRLGVDAQTAHSPVAKLREKFGQNHEYFEGNTIFFAGGRLQNSRNRPLNIGVGIIVLIPSILFFVFSAPWLWNNVSPAIPITVAYLFFICFSSFLHASASDPGILPRNLHRVPTPDENEDLLTIESPTHNWVQVKSFDKTVAAMEVPTKFCRTCNIWRPPRSHHCRLCDNCVETQDHHCAWLNTCIGRRNYRYFFAFIFSGTLLGLYLIAGSLAHILIYASRQGVALAEVIDTLRLPLAVVVSSFLAMVYPLMLTGYHMFLMSRGETTREYLNSQKFLKQDRHRVFSQFNWVKNWIVVLCRPRVPTYYQFKGRYAAGDQRLGATKRIPAAKTAPRKRQDDVEMHTLGRAA